MTTKSRRNRTMPGTDMGFRLLDSANNINNYYLKVVNNEPPEPPRAPEPYKIIPSSSTSRAHRKSSFVILAETEETLEKSLNNSPTHGVEQSVRSARSRSPLSPNRFYRTGRASPFRPRGFKGPPPHAQSRPPSPPPPATINRRRFVQPKSLSQGNSPRKQSLIPQPRGGLTTMKNKNLKPERERWERRGSRKFTRLPRTSSLKTPQPVRRPLIEATSIKVPKAKLPKTVTKLPKQAIKSPTKIPIRNPSNLNNGRFVKVKNNNNDKAIKQESSTTQQQQLAVSSVPISKVPIPTDSSPLVTDESVIMAGDSGSSDNSIKKIKEDEELGLVDLLKQSSGASGTSSVVNATTTTAVQPLRIDAAAIFPQSGVVVTDKKELQENDDSSPVQRTEVEKSQTVTAVASVEPVKEELSIQPVLQQVTKSKTSKDEVKNDKNPIQLKNNPVEVEATQSNSNTKDTTVVNDEIKRTTKPQSNRTSPHSTSKECSEIERTTEDLIDVQASKTAKDKLKNHGSEASLKSSKSNDLSTGSVESIRSTDTGVSLNTVRGIRGVSSAREKRGTHLVKRADEIETLSGNVMHYDHAERRPENGEPAIVEASEPVIAEVNHQSQENLTRAQRFNRWRNSVLVRLRERWRSSAMTCIGCRRGKTKEQMPARAAKRSGEGGGWLKTACCRGIMSGSKIAPSEATSCCRAEQSCGLLCSRNWCRLPSCTCCRRCNCCRRSSDAERKRSIRAKHSLTSVAPPPLSEAQKLKIPEVLVEHNSVMRGAIPCLPVPIAWFCLVWNVLLPGTGTIWSGLFNLCIGQPRFSQTTSAKGRFGALIVNIIVGVSQAFTVLFCLVGWGWSIWWAVTMIRLARKWKRFKASEAANGDPEAHGPEGVLPAPGVPPQTLRGQERAR